MNKTICAFIFFNYPYVYGITSLQISLSMELISLWTIFQHFLDIWKRLLQNININNEVKILEHVIHPTEWALCGMKWWKIGPDISCIMVPSRLIRIINERDEISLNYQVIESMSDQMGQRIISECVDKLNRKYKIS